MKKIYINPQNPVGSMISGESLKYLIKNEVVSVKCVIYDGELTDGDEFDYVDSIEDKDTFAVMVNQNSTNVEFVLLFSTAMVVITTDQSLKKTYTQSEIDSRLE